MQQHVIVTESVSSIKSSLSWSKQL